MNVAKALKDREVGKKIDTQKMGEYMERKRRLQERNQRLQAQLQGGGEEPPRRRMRLPENVAAATFPPPMKTGGLIKETGVYTLHKGEVVVPANRVKSVDMSLKKDKKKPLKK